MPSKYLKNLIEVRGFYLNYFNDLLSKKKEHVFKVSALERVQKNNLYERENFTISKNFSSILVAKLYFIYFKISFKNIQKLIYFFNSIDIRFFNGEYKKTMDSR